ncbi:hypothetical protein [Gimesia aquarii]|uniref:Uncharacterized protein n=1 Tax=Gimesia aquarii TaxID=2527964 RepID=A0A517WVW8_9PLAN|nr:hypothetical protein [Gimesia aquarii]QDU09415.1 hypothetical protein V202x_27900 [Gimesia aquarii]
MQPFDLIMIVVLVLFLLLMSLILVRCVKDLSRHKGSTGSGSGGIIGMMVEMDRIVNPLSEHVTEAKEVERQEEEIGGD